MSKVIAIVNGKGGVGKSTLTSNIASFLFKEGKEALIVDLDFQSSSLDWSSTARAYSYEVCDVISLASGSVEKHLIVQNTQLQINRFRKKYDYILIDCRGTLDEFTIGAIRSADLVITPLSSSAIDLQPTSVLVDMFDNINASKGYSMALKLVLNNVVQNTKTLEDARVAIEKAIKENPYVELCQTNIYRREDYKTMWGEGKSIFDSKNDKAITEFSSFISELNI